MPVSAFPETEEYLRELLRDCRLDLPRFSRPLSRCVLTQCRGTCCHDGVYLSGEESQRIRELTTKHRSAPLFQRLLLPDQVVVYGKSRHSQGPKTATRPAPMREQAEDYPAHFPDTCCVFLDEQSRCGWQRLAEAEERDPWYYKPFTCWMHPISLFQDDSGNAILTLHDQHCDPQSSAEYPGFVPFTHCGKTDPGGKPAWEILTPELTRLGELAGRDFLDEFSQAG